MTISAEARARWRAASTVLPAVCGERTTFGAVRSGLSGGGRLDLEHVEAGAGEAAFGGGPRRGPVSSTMPPRAALTRMAVGFISASSARPIRCRVVSVSGTCSETTSAAASSAASSSTFSAPRSRDRLRRKARVVGEDPHLGSRRRRSARPGRRYCRCRRGRACGRESWPNCRSGSAPHSRRR